jgi:nucleotide-binding universal stress UspA family protein
VARSENTSPVLIAYDGSDFAKGAIAEAANQLAVGRRAIVLTVSEPLGGIPYFGAAGAPVEPETVEGLIDAAKESAQKVAEEGAELARDAGLDAEPLVAIGGPIWNLIVEAADQQGADPIVIGSRGRSGVAHVLLGSVAAAVAQHSKRSVLIVHPRV